MKTTIVAVDDMIAPIIVAANIVIAKSIQGRFLVKDRLINQRANRRENPVDLKPSARPRQAIIKITIQFPIETANNSFGVSTPSTEKRARLIRLGKLIPTNTHRIMVKKKIPITFIPSGVNGLRGGNNVRITSITVAATGAIHQVFFIEFLP